MINSPLKVLIVDDEKGACDNLNNLLSEYIPDDIYVAGIAHNTQEASELVERLSPDGVFLDIEMPNENAFEFLERTSPINYEVIFVTAYDEYAIRAFKLNAVDYILKPISIPELIDAVRKMKERAEAKKLLQQNHPDDFKEMSQLISRKSRGQRITLKDGANIEVVDFADIIFIEAQGSYSRIQYQKQGTLREKIMSSSLSYYEELVPDDTFFRIHKSYLINCKHVRGIIKGEINQVMMTPESQLPVSRRRIGALLNFLEENEQYGS